jgi:hypothetical protein
MRYLIYLFSIGSSFAQNARLDPEYGEVGFRNPSDFWIILFSTLIHFLAPALISSRTGGFYWKWWFVFFGATVFVFAFLPKSTSNYTLILLFNVGITIYGLSRSPEKESSSTTRTDVLLKNIPNNEAGRIEKKTKSKSESPYKKKVWAVLGERVFNKETQKTYKYEITKSKLALKIFDELSGEYITMVNISNVDLIKFINGNAYVECPRCSFVNEIAQADKAVILCDECHFGWAQDLKVYE